MVGAPSGQRKAGVETSRFTRRIYTRPQMSNPSQGGSNLESQTRADGDPRGSDNKRPLQKIGAGGGHEERRHDTGTASDRDAGSKAGLWRLLYRMTERSFRVLVAAANGGRL
jgi:hypothetical protein